VARASALTPARRLDPWDGRRGEASLGSPKEVFGVIKTSDPERMQIVLSGLDALEVQEVDG
jgi:hypothetical protein